MDPNQQNDRIPDSTSSRIESDSSQNYANEVGLVDVDDKLAKMPMVPPKSSTDPEEQKKERALDYETFMSIVSMIRYAAIKYSQRKDDIIRYLVRLKPDPELNDHVFIYEAGSRESHLEAVKYIETVIPPHGSFYADERPVPTIFRQHNSIFIDKLLVDVSSIKQDALFWWQPVSDPYLVEALMPLSRYIERYDPTSNPFTIGGLKSQITTSV